MDVLIGRFPGTDPSSLKSTKRQLEQLLDKSYKIRYCSDKKDIPHANSIKLIVMPGGNYQQMEPSIKSLAYKIYSLVVNKGVSYLGIGAGALAVCDKIHYINCQPPLKQGIGLFPWDCCKIDAAQFCPLVQVTAPASYNMHLQNSYPLFLLAKDHFAFNGENGEVLLKISSQKQEAAAIACKAGSARMVLSNVHPEMDAQAVEALYPKIFSSFQEMQSYEEGQKKTMLSFLHNLGLSTKTSHSDR
ncbi:MAG: Biotin-protein ligase, terminal [Chlamydiales bacterium]|jgi:glutamine amidotransferase-like uncharacterized protein|nr:Biotin-protein ligase, terminal [Chlamydiales bacterium]